jgi:hypothetical protein
LLAEEEENAPTRGSMKIVIVQHHDQVFAEMSGLIESLESARLRPPSLITDTTYGLRR